MGARAPSPAAAAASRGAAPSVGRATRRAGSRPARARAEAERRGEELDVGARARERARRARGRRAACTRAGRRARRARGATRTEWVSTARRRCTISRGRCSSAAGTSSTATRGRPATRGLPARDARSSRRPTAPTSSACRSCRPGRCRCSTDGRRCSRKARSRDRPVAGAVLGLADTPLTRASSAPASPVRRTRSSSTSGHLRGPRQGADQRPRRASGGSATRPSRRPVRGRRTCTRRTTSADPRSAAEVERARASSRPGAARATVVLAGDFNSARRALPGYSAPGPGSTTSSFAAPCPTPVGRGPLERRCTTASSSPIMPPVEARVG